jgi:glycosyltransferase involved in cell wall biosynthesis
MRKKFLEKGFKYDSLRMIPNPVDTNYIQMMSKRESGESSSRFVVVGRLVEQKRVDLAIEMVSAIENVSLTIIGDGPKRNELELLVERLGVANRVEFRGRLENPWSLIRQSKGLIICSAWEGMPNTVLESLFLGIPVFSLGSPGGLGELARERVGIYVCNSLPELGALLQSQAVQTKASSVAYLPRKFYLASVCARLSELVGV